MIYYVGMKKSFLFILPIISSFTLSSCSGIDAEHSIVPMINYDSYITNTGLENAYEIDGDLLFSMLDNKMSFVLEIYQDNCSLCQTFNPILDEYIKNTNRQFYRLPLNNSGDWHFFEDTLLKEFPDALGTFLGTPSVFLIEEGKLTYEVDYHKFSSLTAFSKIIDKHFYPSTMYSVSTVSGLQYFLRDFDNTFIYMLDYTSLISMDIFKEIYNKMKDSNKNILVIDANSITPANYLDICTYLDVNITDHFAIYRNGEEVRKNTNYVNDEGVSLKEWVINYLS